MNENESSRGDVEAHSHQEDALFQTEKARRAIEAACEHTIARMERGELTGKAALESVGSSLAILAGSPDMRPLGPLLALKRSLTIEEQLEVLPPRQFVLTKTADDGTEVGFLPAGKIGLVVGTGGVGKTTALTQLAIAVATGQPWLEVYKVPKPGKVLIAFGEENHYDVKEKFQMCINAMPWIGSHREKEFRQKIAENIEYIPLCSIPTALLDNDRGTVTVSSHLDDLVATVEQSRSALVILDPLSRFAGAMNENDNGAATMFVQAAERLTRLEFEPSVLIVHHTNKAGSTGDASPNAVRGAGAFLAGARWGVQFMRGPKVALGEYGYEYGTVIMSQIKTNLTVDSEDQWLVRRKGGYLSAPVDDEIGKIENAKGAGSDGEKQATAKPISAEQKRLMELGAAMEKKIRGEALTQNQAQSLKQLYLGSK